MHDWVFELIDNQCFDRVFTWKRAEVDSSAKNSTSLIWEEINSYQWLRMRRLKTDLGHWARDIFLRKRDYKFYHVFDASSSASTYIDFVFVKVTRVLLTVWYLFNTSLRFSRIIETHKNLLKSAINWLTMSQLQINGVANCNFCKIFSSDLYRNKIYSLALLDASNTWQNL